MPSPQNRPQGCPFATRCPRKVGVICDTTPPPTQTTASGHRIFCHIPLDDLKKVDEVVVV
jgi:peptide/nickel transport system ATP-binding protein